MEKKAMNLLIILLILSAVMLNGCIQNPEAAIIGKWDEIDGTETIEFFKDGTITVDDKGMSFGGDYKFIDNDRIRIELGGLGALAGPMIVKVSISKDELSLTTSDGDIDKYQRVK